MNDVISRQVAIDGLASIAKAKAKSDAQKSLMGRVMFFTEHLPSAQPEIIRCKDCEYGEQDEVGRWFCRSLGCQIGNEDGSGYCADAERRTDESNVRDK